MRSVKLFLGDIIESCEEIALFLADIESEIVFVNNSLVRQAVRAQLINIGEAVSKLPLHIRERYPEADWRRISAFPNILVHEYFGLDWSLVWISATMDVPKLRNLVMRIDESLEEDDSGFSEHKAV